MFDKTISQVDTSRPLLFQEIAVVIAMIEISTVSINCNIVFTCPNKLLYFPSTFIVILTIYCELYDRPFRCFYRL